MKKVFVFFFLLFSFSIVRAQAPFRAQSISTLIEKSQVDSIACIERMAAYYFHKILNNYRSDKGLSRLHWNDTLWIAAMNHSLWMSRQNELTHTERAKTWYYTGRYVEERVVYAGSGSKNLSWSAENALYNFSILGKDISAIAIKMARHSFEQWINSPGHKKNILKASNSSHGVAFILTSERVWVTDVFAFNGSGLPELEFPTSSLFHLRRLKVD